MRKKFGVFKAIGERAVFNGPAFIGLAKMSVASADSLVELEEMINNNNLIPANMDYIIMEYWDYTKR